MSISSFSTCLDDARFALNNFEIEYNQDTGNITFGFRDSSNTSQNISAVLGVTVFGKSIYSMDFNLCEARSFIAQLCPGHIPEMIFG